MFEIGEYVSYGNSGICLVDAVTMMPSVVNDCEKEYYILQPIMHNAGKVYTPVDNEKVFMRYLITADEAMQLLDDIPKLDVVTLTNPRDIDAEYKRRIRTGDCHMWASILKTIYGKKLVREKVGKKLTSSDERYLRDVSNRLYNELSYVLEKDVEEVESMVRTAIDNALVSMQ